MNLFHRILPNETYRKISYRLPGDKRELDGPIYILLYFYHGNLRELILVYMGYFMKFFVYSGVFYVK